MHAAASTREFNESYTETKVTRELKKTGSRLLEPDQNPGAEVQRVIVCHIKHKDPEKKAKRNKPCKQFRKQKETSRVNVKQTATRKAGLNAPQLRSRKMACPIIVNSQDQSEDSYGEEDSEDEIESEDIL